MFFTAFLETRKLSGNTNIIHKEAAMWLLPVFVREMLFNPLNIHICAVYRTAPLIAVVRSNDTRSRELLRFYAEVLTYLIR